MVLDGDPQDQSTEILDLGTRQYYLGKVIGNGNYSKVHMAMYRYDSKKSKIVATKIIDKEKAGHEFVSKFLPRELSVLRRMAHPNIVSVFDTIESNSKVYIFMSYCKNGDLLNYIKRWKRCSEKTSKKFFTQIVSAVYYLHSKNVAHRDLKCENILLFDRNTVKLGDFGFARYCEENGEKVLSDTYCGSAAYAAPEVLEGILYNPKKYDIWSLGCILYIMLTGNMPFDDTNITKMIKFQKRRKIITQVNKNLLFCDPLKDLIIKLLEPNVDKRATVSFILKNNWITNNPTLLKQNLRKVWDHDEIKTNFLNIV